LAKHYKQSLADRLTTRERFLWFIPPGIFLLAGILGEKTSLEVAGGCVALLLLGYFVNRPGIALITLIIFLPLETVGFSLLYRIGVPGPLLRGLSEMKELIVVAIVLAGLRVIRDTGRKLDRIDVALLTYVGVVVLYLIIPHLFSANAPTLLNQRLVGFRSDAFYPLIFFGCRHAPLGTHYKERFMQVILYLGGGIALLGLYQKVAARSWQNFIFHTARVQIYEVRVLNSLPSAVEKNLGYVTSLSPLRIGSVFLGPFALGDYTIIVATLAALRIRQNHREWLPYAVLAVSLAANFFTGSRSDGLALIVVLVLVAVPNAKTPVEGRLRLIAGIVLAAVLIVPALAGTRDVGAHGGGKSASGHLSEIQDGLHLIETVPFGLGLGDQPGDSIRFANEQKVIYGGDISDNSITQVGDELGVQALLPWLLMVAFIFLALKRRASSGDFFATVMGLSLLGVMIAAQYHQAFLDYPLPWTLWGGAGLALSATQRPDYEDSEYPMTSAMAAPSVR
jgi:hypothetical protein